MTADQTTRDRMLAEAEEERKAIAARVVSLRSEVDRLRKELATVTAELQAKIAEATQAARAAAREEEQASDLVKMLTPRKPRTRAASVSPLTDEQVADIGERVTGPRPIEDSDQ